MADNKWMGGWTGSGVALPAPASASFGNGGMGAFATARLDRPDRALRKIAIKQMSGQQLTANEIDRLARRQGVEARYEEAGNNNFGKMDSAYGKAGVPVMMRQRMGAEGSALGAMAARYGEEGVGDVQRLARERLLREEELGNLRLDEARFAQSHREEDYDWARALRERQRQNWDIADHKLADEESARSALMATAVGESQLAETPRSLLSAEYRNADGSVNRNSVLENGITEAARQGNFGAYSALNGELLRRQNAVRSAEADRRKAREGDLRAQKLEADLQKSRTQNNVEFVNAPDGSLLYKYGNSIGKLGNSSGAKNGFEEYSSKAVVVRDGGGKVAEVIQPYIQTVGKGGVVERKPNPRYIEFMNTHGNPPPAGGGNGTAGEPPKDAQTKRGSLIKRLGF